MYDVTLFGRAEEEYVEVKCMATSLLKDKCAHLSGEKKSTKVQSI